MLVLQEQYDYIKWGFESRLKPHWDNISISLNYIKWGFESRLKQTSRTSNEIRIISNGDLRVD